MTNETDTVEATATVGGSLLEAVVMPDSMQKEYQIENLKREIKDRDAMIVALIMAAGGEILIPTHLLSSMEYRGKTLVRTDTLNGVKYHVGQAYQPASELTQLLAERIKALVAEHNGVRAAARHLRCDPAYLLRLHDGEKTNPSEAILKKLGLKKVVTYVRDE